MAFKEYPSAVSVDELSQLSPEQRNRVLMIRRRAESMRRRAAVALLEAEVTEQVAYLLVSRGDEILRKIEAHLSKVPKIIND